MILNWFSSMVEFLADAIPSLPDDLAAHLSAVPGQIDSIAGTIAVLSPIVPFSHINTCFTLVVSGFVAGFVLFVILKIISFSTGGGGAL